MAKLIDVGRGGWSLLLGQLTKQASRILEKFADARAGNLPDGRQSTEDWLKSYTSNAFGSCDLPQPVRGDLCLQCRRAAGSSLPDYFTSKGAFKRFGFCPQGTIGVWNALASVIKRNGDIWLATPAVEIHTIDGRVRGRRSLFGTVRKSGSIPTRHQQYRFRRRRSRSAAKPHSLKPMSSRYATGFAPPPTS